MQTADSSVPRLLSLLAEWMETFPYDFRDERVMAHVRSIISKCADNAVTAGVTSILQTLLDRLMALQRYEEFLQRPPLDDKVRDCNRIWEHFLNSVYHPILVIATV